MIVLVDTSVWVRFLANQAPYAAGVNHLLQLEMVVAHDFVYGELLAGDLGARQKFLGWYSKMLRAQLRPHQEVVNLVRTEKLHGRGAGWVDLHLLASALDGGMALWTADRRLAAIADELGIAYRIENRLAELN